MGPRRSKTCPLLLMPAMAWNRLDTSWVSAFAGQRPVIVFDQQGTAAPQIRRARCRTSSSPTMPRRCARVNVERADVMASRKASLAARAPSPDACQQGLAVHPYARTAGIRPVLAGIESKAAHR